LRITSEHLVKELIKQFGGRWDPQKKVWYFVGKSKLSIQIFLQKCSAQKGKEQSNIKYSNIENQLEKAKQFWNHLMHKNEIYKQIPDIKNAKISVKYVDIDEKVAKYHAIIRYIDSNLIPFADQTVRYLQTIGCEAINDRGEMLSF
jgi:hypothetical protein